MAQVLGIASLMAASCSEIVGEVPDMVLIEVGMIVEDDGDGWMLLS
jgi:hypothetical protein